MSGNGSQRSLEIRLSTDWSSTRAPALGELEVRP